MEINKPLNQYKMDQEQYLHEVGQNLADLFYNQKNINMKTELEEAAERLQKDKYGIFISKEADVKGQLVIDTAKAAFLSGMIEGAKWMEEQMEKLKDFEVWKEWVNEKS